MKFQCFEIKPEDGTNECSHDDKPSFGMFAGFDEQILFPMFCICFAVSIILFFISYFLERLLIDVSCDNIALCTIVHLNYLLLLMCYFKIFVYFI